MLHVEIEFDRRLSRIYDSAKCAINTQTAPGCTTQVQLVDATVESTVFIYKDSSRAEHHTAIAATNRSLGSDRERIHAVIVLSVKDVAQLARHELLTSFLRTAIDQCGRNENDSHQWSVFIHAPSDVRKGSGSGDLAASATVGMCAPIPVQIPSVVSISAFQSEDEIACQLLVLARRYASLSRSNDTNDHVTTMKRDGKKCEASDFHALYLAMLAEVHAVSALRAVGVAEISSTMCGLLEHANGVEEGSNTVHSSQQPPERTANEEGANSTELQRALTYTYQSVSERHFRASLIEESASLHKLHV